MPSQYWWLVIAAIAGVSAALVTFAVLLHRERHRLLPPQADVAPAPLLLPEKPVRRHPRPVRYIPHHRDPLSFEDYPTVIRALPAPVGHRRTRAMGEK